MQIVVNGQPQKLPDGATVRDLVRALGVPVDGVAVAVNLSVVPRSAHAAHALADGDRVEVIQAVGGG